MTAFDIDFDQDEQPFSPEQLERFAAEERRERRARDAVTSKSKKIHADLLRLERFALDHGVVFLPFHELLVSSIYRLEGFISDYDPEYLEAFARDRGVPPKTKTAAAPEPAPPLPEPEAEPQRPIEPPSPAAILKGVNAHAHQGSGFHECAIVEARESGGFLACLYFAADFADSAKVAGWFHALGATSVVIDHTLYSDVDGDRDGLTHGCQAWTVYFDLPGDAEELRPPGGE